MMFIVIPCRTRNPFPGLTRFITLYAFLEVMTSPGTTCAITALAAESRPAQRTADAKARAHPVFLTSRRIFLLTATITHLRQAALYRIEYSETLHLPSASIIGTTIST